MEQDKFEILFTEENAEKAAEYIVNRFDDKDTILDFDFYLKKGKFVSNKTNTVFKFNTQKNSILRDVLDVLTDESIEPTERRIELFNSFRENVESCLVEKYRSQLADKLREKVLGNEVTAKQVPMKELKVNFFEITDIGPASRYILVVEKNGIDKVPQMVANDLYAYIYEFEDEISQDPHFDILSELKAYVVKKVESGDEAFLSIKDIKIKSTFCECQVDLFVDYTFAD